MRLSILVLPTQVKSCSIGVYNVSRSSVQNRMCAC